MMAGMTSPDHAPHEPLPADVFARGCSSRGALQHLTGRWGALTIVALRLADEPMRFSEVRRRVDGDRTVIEGVPGGRSAAQVLAALGNLGVEVIDVRDPATTSSPQEER